MKFYPSGSGKYPTFVTVRDKIISRVGKEFDHGVDMAQSIRDMKMTNLSGQEPKMGDNTIPTSQTEAHSRAEKVLERTFDLEMKVFIERRDMLRQNESKAFALIFDEYCSKTIKSRVESLPEYEDKIYNNPIELLKAIRTAMSAPMRARYVMKSGMDVLLDLLLIKQRDNESVGDFVKRFKQYRDVVKAHWGDSLAHQLIKNSPEYSDETDTDKQQDMVDNSFDQAMAYLLLLRSDHSKYGSMLSSLQEQFSRGTDQYPKTLESAYDQLYNHKFDNNGKSRSNQQQRGEKDKDKDKDQSSESVGAGTETSFVQNNSSYRCFICGSPDHSKSKCPHKDRPKDKWWINTVQQHYQSQTSNSDRSVRFQNEEQVDNWMYCQKHAEEPVEREEQVDAWMYCQEPVEQQHYTTSLKSRKLTLDSATTVTLIGNPELVTGIRNLRKDMFIGTNGGIKKVDKEATMPGLGDFPFSETSIANIVALKDVIKKHRVTFDSAKENAFIVHPTQKGNKIIKFTSTPEGLYEYEVSNKYLQLCKKQNNNQEHAQQPHHVMNNNIATVKERLDGLTKRQQARIQRAKELYAALGSPSIRDLKAAISTNKIKGNPVTVKDVALAEKVYGPDIGSLKGKTTRPKTRSTQDDDDLIEIPRSILQANPTVEIAFDTMFINERPFLTSIDRSIKFRTVVPLKLDPDSSEYKRALWLILRLYNNGGFLVTTLHCDNEHHKTILELQQSDQQMSEINVNFAQPNEHVPDAERNNRFIQERVRSTYHRLPCKFLPHSMIRHIAMDVTFKANCFPSKTGVSNEHSPHVIVTRRHLDYAKHCAIPTGAFVQATHVNKITNNQKPRTTDAVYLRASPQSIQGGHEVLNLDSGRVLSRQAVKVLPTPQWVIERVNELGEEDYPNKLKFSDRYGDEALFAGVDTGNNNNNTNDGYDSESSDEEYNPEEEDDYQAQTEADEDLYESKSNNNSTHGDQGDEEAIVEDNNAGEESVPSEDEEDPVNEEIEQSSESGEEEESEEESESEQEQEPNQCRHSQTGRVVKPVERLNVKSSQGKSYLQAVVGTTGLDLCHNMVTQVSPNPDRDVKYGYDHSLLISRCMVEMHYQFTIGNYCFGQQFSFKKGMKKFGDRAKAGADKELSQLHGRKCFTPVSVKDLTPTEKMRAQVMMMLIEQKSSGKVKGRAVFNGKPTRRWLSRDEAASPTASQESVFLTSVIDAKEGRDVMTNDVPNAFIQSHLEQPKPGEDRVIMKITGVLVDMLVALAPELYGPFIVFENGKKVLYVVVLKAIYGMLVAALTWYKQFRKDLEGHGFTFSQYDPCVAYKTVEGSQHTILFHVDDVKSSHKKPEVNDKFAEWLEDMYGGEHGQVKTHRGKIHEYLGMTLDFSEPGKVKIKMIDYVKDMLESFPEELPNKQVQCAAPPDLFGQNSEGDRPLERDKQEAFHTTVAKGLYLTKRARPDIQTAIAYLCTRVSNSTTADWDKLVHLLLYLKETRELFLTLSADDLRVLKWYVDASFAVHKDYKSHTGGGLTMGGGFPISVSRKQKLNTKSSTVAELVGADDLSVLILWTKLFMEELGYHIEKNILHQDNKSAILLETNGRKSAGKQSRAINVRYFFLTDQVKKGNLSIEYCPTDEMVGGFWTKPLQGSKFKEFRDLVLGIT